MNDARGYAHLPKQVREELNHKSRGKIPYSVNANAVLLIRKGANKNQVLEGIDLLKKDINLRWGEENEEV